MIIELILIKYCTNKIKEYNIEKYTDKEVNMEEEDTSVATGVLVTVLIIAILSLIFSIWGIVDSVKRCKGDDRVGGILLALFCWPIYWILRLSGAVCRHN